MGQRTHRVKLASHRLLGLAHHREVAPLVDVCLRRRCHLLEVLDSSIPRLDAHLRGGQPKGRGGSGGAKADEGEEPEDTFPAEGLLQHAQWVARGGAADLCNHFDEAARGGGDSRRHDLSREEAEQHVHRKGAQAEPQVAQLRDRR